MVPSRLWTPSSASIPLGSLPLLVLESLWSWPMRTHCVHHRVPALSLVHSLHPLDSNDPIVCATSLHCQVSRSWNSSWILECCRVNETNCFLVSVLLEFPSADSCSHLLSGKWSYVPTPCIFSMIRVLKNSKARIKHFWVRIEIPLCLRVCWSSQTWDFLTTDWMGTKARSESMSVTMWSLKLLFTNMPAVFHWVRAAQCSSSGEGNVGPLATDSCLPPSVCLLHALSRWPFSLHLMHCAASFLQSLAKCSGIPHTTQFPFPVPSWSQASLPVSLNHFVPCVSVLCSHGNSAAFSSTLWSSLPGWIFPV